MKDFLKAVFLGILTAIVVTIMISVVFLVFRREKSVPINSYLEYKELRVGFEEKIDTWVEDHKYDEDTPRDGFEGITYSNDNGRQTVIIGIQELGEEDEMDDVTLKLFFNILEKNIKEMDVDDLVGNLGGDGEVTAEERPEIIEIHGYKWVRMICTYKDLNENKEYGMKVFITLTKTKNYMVAYMDEDKDNVCNMADVEILEK